jgi:hypothetical protein
MSRYYLHLRNFKGDVLEDGEGSECQNLAAAKAHALLAMNELIGEAIKRGDEPAFEAIVIADERATHLAAVPLTAALPSAVRDALKRPEKVFPTNRFEEFRHQADECRAKAEGTDDTDDRVSWLKLAHAWLEMLPPAHLPRDLIGWPEPSDEHSKASH